MPIHQKLGPHDQIAHRVCKGFVIVKINARDWRVYKRITSPLGPRLGQFTTLGEARDAILKGRISEKNPMPVDKD